MPEVMTVVSGVEQGAPMKRPRLVPAGSETSAP